MHSRQVTEYENHLSSYDHHHKKRFKEMREAEKASPVVLASCRNSPPLCWLRLCLILGGEVLMHALSHAFPPHTGAR